MGCHVPGEAVCLNEPLALDGQAIHARLRRKPKGQGLDTPEQPSSWLGTAMALCSLFSQPARYQLHQTSQVAGYHTEMCAGGNCIQTGKWTAIWL